MTPEQIVEQITKILNTPTCIAGVTIGSLLLFFIVIISKTSIGRKALKTLSGKVDNAKAALEEAHAEYNKLKNGYDEYKKVAQETINELRSDYEIKLSGVQQVAAKEEKLLIAIAENVHNGEVQKQLENYVKDTTVSLSAEASTIVENAKKEVINETKDELESLKAEIEALKAEARQIKSESEQIINDVKNEGENIVNEIKEDIEEVKEGVEDGE